ncbi:MAG: hypothetical protein MUO26_05830 [Methanotrichaceae archaeon]|nr:hypothetical protein [Methanotrichaceae archaeon]
MNQYLLISHDLGIDLIEAAKKKLEENNKKYPIEKVIRDSRYHDKSGNRP